MVVRVIALVLLPIFFASSGALGENTLALNHRELCRRTVSGVYADLVGDLYQAEDHIEIASKSLKQSKALLENHEAKLKILNKQIMTNDYDARLLDERDAISAQIKLYHEQHLTSESQLESAKKKLEATRKRHASITQKVNVIFTSSFTPDPEGRPRKLFQSLQWRSPCPKYRSLCPLPAKEAKVLTSLLDEIDDHEMACFRYSKMR